MGTRHTIGTRRTRRGWVRLAVFASVAGAPVLGIATPASAHVHEVYVAHQGAGQVLADGQVHGAYTIIDGQYVSCGGSPAAYGLESAHHGPDAGTPGKADGCYQTSDGLSPSQDVTNPVIR